MSEDLFTCIASCHSVNSSGALVGNDSYDLECINQCSQHHTTLYQNTAEKYTQILQIIAVVLITFGLFGKLLNCIIFLRKPLRGTSTGLLLLLKTLFDTFPLLWTFIFDTKFFVKDEQINGSRLLCVLSRSSDIFVSWSIGFVILACTIRLVTIVHSKHLPEPTRLRVSLLIIVMMICGLIYNWHVFYYPNLVEKVNIDDKNRTFTYCNILFGRHMGYFSFGGFQTIQELVYNAPIVNFVVSSLIPFTLIASTNLVIIVFVLKAPATRISRINTYRKNTSDSVNLRRPSLPNITIQLTKKAVSYETTITLTTSCVFLTTNSIASIYVYVKSSRRSAGFQLTEDLKTSNVYLILRMLTLIDTVLEFYIYFLTGKKFREEVYQLLREILSYTPLRNYLKLTRTSPSSTLPPRVNNQSETSRKNPSILKKNSFTSPPSMKSFDMAMEPFQRMTFPSRRFEHHHDETLDRIESTV